MDLKEAMAMNVRRMRHEKKMTQEELADRAGLSTRYLGSIERAVVSASVTVLGQIARALRVDPGELINFPTVENRDPIGSARQQSRDLLPRRPRAPAHPRA
jgi:transcriptional regulator with XRE-family HTH domain